MGQRHDTWIPIHSNRIQRLEDLVDVHLIQTQRNLEDTDYLFTTLNQGGEELIALPR